MTEDNSFDETERTRRKKIPTACRGEASLPPPVALLCRRSRGLTLPNSQQLYK